MIRKILLLLFIVVFSSSQAGAETRPHFLQISNKPVIDVRQYGAKGDGVTDDTAAIQAAFDVGGSIQFCTGQTYRHLWNIVKCQCNF